MTRIPIAGDSEIKKEEVFFNGAWDLFQIILKRLITY